MSRWMAAAKAQPLWQEIELAAFAPLDRDITVDVVVIGAGLTGLTAAYLLKQSGLQVALLDRRAVGGTDTGCTTAHLTVVGLRWLYWVVGYASFILQRMLV